MPVYADRVKETSTTTGTGTLDLDGAVEGHRTFVDGVGGGAEVLYTIQMGSEWEIGLGTVTDASPDTLSRDTVSESSNAGALVNFSAGTKTVFVGVPAAILARLQGPPVVSRTADLTLTAAMAGTLFNNAGAGGQVVLTLPPADQDMAFRFSVKAAFNLRILAAGSDTIRVAGSETAGGGHVNANTVGTTLHLIREDTVWTAHSVVLSWS